MKRATRRDVQRYGHYTEEIGHNPARFLATRSESGRATGEGDSPELALAKSVIKGIDDTATLDAWQAVEVDLGRNDGGPRQLVMAWLNRRRDVLEGNAVDNVEAGLATAPVDVEYDSVPESRTETKPPVAMADGGSDEKLCGACQATLEREELDDQVGWWCPVCSDYSQPAEVMV
ncbi:hypothetical protein [Halomarina oriensis]|uniref:DUF8129 domain-containing protein n=1 Tax=Halomarina oriensis TaxID=671145 RepID=A0A6B0GRF4_9EURY|nr:hypothetical protein [Halomarina oriensis]MWG36199.1 hypothetical protein [Halomarina oriensis]